MEDDQIGSVADFFVGIGLAGAGLRRAGWGVNYAVDHDPGKLRMYEHHHGEASYYHVEDVADVAGSDIPNVDLAHSSFPCTDTSVAGGRSGIHGDGESSSYWEFVRIMEEMGERRPPMITLENVEGFLTSGGGEDITAALKALNELDYVVDVMIIDARHFVPQSRVRLFVVAQQRAPQDSLKQEVVLNQSGDERPKKVREYIRSHPEIDWHLRDLPTLPTTDLTVKDIVDESENGWWKEDRAEYLFSQMFERHEKVLAEMMEKDEWSYGTVFRRTRKRDGRRQSTAELRTDGIAGCLRTPKGGSARQILVRAGYGERDARLLNGRECARLMGVPDYKLDESESLNHFLWGFGDAVCASVMEWLALHYLNPVLSVIKRDRQRNQVDLPRHA